VFILEGYTHARPRTRRARPWSLRAQAFVRQFEVRVDSLRGVYVHLDMNVSDLLIYDKNGPGKLLVLGSTMALKFGK
jgi:hypothetical protein